MPMAVGQVILLPFPHGASGESTPLLQMPFVIPPEHSIQTWQPPLAVQFMFVQGPRLRGSQFPELL